MKAMLLDRPGPVDDHPLRMSEVATPSPAHDEVLIKVTACGVCRTDLHVIEGELAPRITPLVPGHQIVGEIVDLGSEVRERALGERVGVAWLQGTCGTCSYCRRGDENLCDAARFTGWTNHGGYAEYVAAPESFAYVLPSSFDDMAVAPLLCAGIIGYRCLRHCELDDWKGARLGLYGFGAAGHIAIQLARHRGAEVFVCTRDRERHQVLARELGAAWVGDTFETPPVPLDAAIIFAPAGEIVPAALKALDRGGQLVLGGIHMSPIPELDYRDLYWERVVRSVANNTREDGRAFLAEAASANVKTHVQVFPLEDANHALAALKHDAIRGAAVLRVNLP